MTDIRNWYQDVQQHASEGACKILVGNKCDWEDKRVRIFYLRQVVTKEQGEQLAEELGMQYIETSAKANTNVDEAFFKLAQQVKDHLVDQGITSNVQGAPGSQTIGAGSGLGGTSDKKGGCC